VLLQPEEQQGNLEEDKLSLQVLVEEGVVEPLGHLQ